MSKILSVAQKKLHSHLRGKGGRGSDGAITVYHRGATKYRRVYRRINFKVENNTDNTEAVILSLHYDPNRTSNIAFVYYSTGYCSYMIAAEGVRIGSTFFLGGSPEKLEEAFTIGAYLPLKLLPIGFVVHNVELEPSAGGKICRAAGSYAVILKKTGSKVLIKLPSGWNMWLNEECLPH
jgi:large subunit ribosomal protein L2